MSIPRVLSEIELVVEDLGEQFIARSDVHSVGVKLGAQDTIFVIVDDVESAVVEEIQAAAGRFTVEAQAGEPFELQQS